MRLKRRGEKEIKKGDQLKRIVERKEDRRLVKEKRGRKRKNRLKVTGKGQRREINDEQTECKIKG